MWSERSYSRKINELADTNLDPDASGKCIVWADACVFPLMCMAAMRISSQRAISMRSDLTA